jgi:RHS repeat-associated protein
MTRKLHPALSLRAVALLSIGALASLIVAGSCLLALALPPVAAAAECTDTWVGPSESSWLTAENWSSGVPTSSDIACIGSGHTAQILFGTQEVAAVQGEGDLLLDSTLVLDGSSEPSSIGKLTMAGGTLTGAGDLQIAEELLFYSINRMSGSGSTAILPGAAVHTTLFSPENILEGRRLVNEGTVSWANGTLYEIGGAEVLNRGVFNANSGEETNIKAVSPEAVFVNQGTFQRTTGTGLHIVSVAFENEGDVTAGAGILSFNGGGSSSSGEWEGAEGAELRFAGNSSFSFTGGSLAENIGIVGLYTIVQLEGGLIEPSSHLSMSSGTLDLTSGATRLRSLSMYGTDDVISGAGDLEISEELLMERSEKMSGSGSTVILPGAVVNTTTFANLVLEGRRFVNEGTYTQTEGSIIELGGSEFLNLGTLTDDSGASKIIQAESAEDVFVNRGTFTFQKKGGGLFSISANFENEGNVTVGAGILTFNGGGSSSSGEWEAAEGGELVFLEGSYSFTGGSLAGKIAVAGHGTIVHVKGGVLQPSSQVATGEATLDLTSGSTRVRSLSMYGGEDRVSGAGDLEISEELLITRADTMSGSGSTVLLPGAVGNTTAFANPILEGRRFVNEGTYAQTEGSMVERGGAEFLNLNTFTDNSGSSKIIEAESANDTNVNRGTFQRTEGGGTQLIEPSFVNHGAIHEGPGHFEFKRPVSAASTEKASKNCKTEEPVACATGDLEESQTDIAIGGLGVGLDLTRFYSAQAAAAAGSPGAFGYGWTASFSDHLVSEEGGNRITLVSGNGSTVPFTKAGAGFKASALSQDLLSGSAEAGYTVVLPDQSEWSFSGAGRLESVSDRNGNQTTLAYGGSGRLETITDPAGREITLAYNGSGEVESAEDPMGHLVKYGYESGKLTSVTMPGEAEPRWQFKYDGSHRITQITDGRGGKTTNEYDGSSRVISQTDPAKRTLTFEYAPFHTTITNVATGAVTDERFTSDNEPYSITRGFGTAAATTETFTYNAAGLLLSKTDGDGHKTTYGYNANGDRTSEKDPAGDESKWTFDSTHDVLSATTPEGEKTTITRDANGNPETISRPAPGKETQTTSFEYGPHGELKSVTDPLSHVWGFEYDSQGDRTAQIDPEGDKRTAEYDEDSRLISTVSPRGNEAGAEASKFTTVIERDPQGRPIEVIDPLKGTTKYEYDPNGNLEVETDPNGHSTHFSYDADNEPIKVERPNGDIEETGYDGAGEVTSQTDGNKGETIYVRNVLEEPIEVIDPLERKTIETFDAAGNLESKTDPEGRTTSYAYDAANRLKEVSYSDGVTPTATFGYDKDGNLTSMKDGTGESSYEYDQLDRLTHSQDGHGDSVGYEYNLGEEQVGLTYPNGKSISRAFDEAGRLESLTDWFGHTTAFAYNEDSELKATTFPSATGNVDEYGYDRADRMSSVAIKKGAETLASLSYTRDKAGQLESLISKGLPGAEEEAFSYDENERLTGAGASNFEYDAANNLTEAPGTTNEYDAAGQLETGTGSTYGYDEEGERTKLTPSSGPASTYKYDQAGNLTAVERAKEGATPAISEDNAYDGTGLLASRSTGPTEYLAWDQSASLPLLLADGENSYIYGPSGLPVEQISSGEVPTYLHHDQLGSTRLLTNAFGEVAGASTYGPYGGLTGHTGTATTALGYAGQYTLGQSGLQYLRARFYDPATGQLMTQDPLVEATREPYAYAGGDPLTHRDPSGLFSIGEITEGVSGIPCPWCGAAKGATEALEGAASEVESGLAWVYNQLGTEKLDEGEGVNEGGSSAEESPCPSAGTKNEIGDRGQERTKDRNFAEKLEQAAGSNPNWPTGGSRLVRIAAIIARIFHLYNR